MKKIMTRTERERERKAKQRTVRINEFPFDYAYLKNIMGQVTF